MSTVLQRRLHSLLVAVWVATHAVEGDAVGEADDDDDAVFFESVEAAHRMRERGKKRMHELFGSDGGVRRVTDAGRM